MTAYFKSKQAFPVNTVCTHASRRRAMSEVSPGFWDLCHTVGGIGCQIYGVAYWCETWNAVCPVRHSESHLRIKKIPCSWVTVKVKYVRYVLA